MCTFSSRCFCHILNAKSFALSVLRLVVHVVSCWRLSPQRKMAIVNVASTFKMVSGTWTTFSPTLWRNRLRDVPFATQRICWRKMPSPAASAVAISPHLPKKDRYRHKPQRYPNWIYTPRESTLVARRIKKTSGERSLKANFEIWASNWRLMRTWVLSSFLFVLTINVINDFKCNQVMMSVAWHS